MPSFRVIAPDQIARARQLYEGTSVPVRDIAALVGLGASTFARRVKLWGWTPRNRRLAEYDAAAKAGVDLAAIEAAAAPAKATLEHGARTLATLVRTLRELAALETIAPDADKEESGDEFRDLEEFRRELTRRLEGLNKKRSGA